MRRRSFLAASVLAGCASSPGGDRPAAERKAEPARLGRPQLWRTLQGGYLAPEPPQPGALPRLPGGAYVRWTRPGAIALRGVELLVADLGSGRLWRADLASQSMSGIAGAPLGPGTALALGSDLSAWVLDPVSRAVLRFGRDGRLLQTHRAGNINTSPVALALADGGLTLLLADGLGAQWSEQRGAGSLLRLVAPEADGGRRITGVDGLAMAKNGLFVLDRSAGAVHRVTREGRVLRSLGMGDLRQPVALAVDRLERVYVHDAFDNAVLRLREDGPAWRWSAAELGVQQIAGIAVDAMMLAVSDAVGAQVVVHSFMHDREP
ncbi:NHL repeat containing protein [Rubrivivax sp. A210]|uniref:hypothetical protein n=1 Tax=Rubrivivax sp. A210 TaxID=2772301 RepID=UPI0019182B4C|nr:hypothetical protein [Rubrivivax sp. A210]CAD5372305.1 NHL repeat containing protein [Rubrivivax sp. A210]